MELLGQFLHIVKPGVCKSLANTIWSWTYKF